MEDSEIESVSPWQALEKGASSGLAFEEELQKELSPNHPLYGQIVVAIARHLGRDDVLFRVEAKLKRYAVVHLTWSGKHEPWPTFPATKFFDSIDDFAEKCMKPDSAGY